MKDNTTSEIEEALKTIESLMLGALPEKRVKTNENTYEGYDRQNPRHRYTTGVDVGFNHAIDQTAQAISKLIKGEE